MFFLTYFSPTIAIIRQNLKITFCFYIKSYIIKIYTHYIQTKKTQKSHLGTIYHATVILIRIGTVKSIESRVIFAILRYFIVKEVDVVILAGVGAGLFSTVEEACDRFVRTQEYCQPIPQNRAYYEKGQKNSIINWLNYSKVRRSV